MIGMLLFVLTLTRLLLFSAPENPKLTVDIQNVKTAKGSVFVAIYRPCEGFPLDCKPINSQRLTAKDGSLQMQFTLEPGDYAVAIYHDVNDNGKMDKNIIGIPKEPYGFSNNFRPRLSPPKFSDCKIVVGDKGKGIAVRLE